MFGKRSLFYHPLLRVAVIFLLGQSFIAQAVPPAWWSQGNPPVVDPNASPDNHGMANIGQAKWMAQSALDELGRVLGIDSPTVEAIRDELFKAEENSFQGVFFPGRPENPSQEWLANQKAPLEIGALKALAAPFYKHLSALDGPWVEARLRENGLQTLGTNYFQDADGTFLPWNPAHNNGFERNHAAATVGQLKLVFSLDFGGDFEEGLFSDGIPDLWESAVVAVIADDDWISISQINSINAVEAGGQTGSGNPPTDRDGDGRLNEADADPDDKVIDWSPGPVPMFAVIELPLQNVEELYLDDFSQNGTVLFTRIRNTGDFNHIVVDSNLVAHSFGHDSFSTGDFSGYSWKLMGDQVPGFYNGNEVLWDPLKNTFTPWHFLGNYHDDIRDSRNGVTIWYGQSVGTTPFGVDAGLRHSPLGELLPDALAVGNDNNAYIFIEKNGNIISQNSYWRKNRYNSGYASPVSIAGSSVSSATVVRPNPPRVPPVDEWNIVATNTGLLVSKNRNAFKLAEGGLGAEAIYSVTEQGWALGAKGIWVNGKWNELRNLLGSPVVSEAELLGILDTGLAVAKIKRGGSAKKIALLVPIEVHGYVTVENNTLVGKVNGRDLYEKTRDRITDSDSPNDVPFLTEAKSRLKIAQFGDIDIIHIDEHNNFTFDDSKFKQDIDIFRVRIPDFPVSTPSGEHRIRISTTDKNGNTLDEGAEVDLNRFSANPSNPNLLVPINETAALALVPDDVDDDSYPVETKEEGLLGDRTYRAVLGGKVKIQWLTAPGSGARPEIEIPVPADRIVTAKGFVLKGTTGNPTAWFERAKKIYSAIGVDLRYTLKTIDPLPNGVILSDDFDIPIETSKYLHQMTPEAVDLFDAKECELSKLGKGVIPVFFVNKFTNYNDINGVSNCPSFMDLGHERFGGAIFIDSTHTYESVLSHELAHILLDAQHQKSPNALWANKYTFRDSKCFVWYGDVKNYGQWLESGIAAHRRFSDSMRSRIWKSSYATPPAP